MDLHEILSSIELLHEHGQFAGTVDQLFYIIEMCASKRPVSRDEPFLYWKPLNGYFCKL